MVNTRSEVKFITTSKSDNKNIKYSKLRKEMVKYVSVFNFMLSNNFTLIKKLLIHLSYLYIIVVLIFPFLSLFPFDEKVLFS